MNIGTRGKQQKMDRLQLLIEKSQNGDKEAFRYIFEETSNRLFVYALSRTKNRDDALDLTQDTFIDIWSALPKFQYSSDEAFYGFVFVILKRKLARHYKNTKSRIIKGSEESYEIEVEDYRYLFKHIETLKEKYQDVLRLRYWSDMTFGEISKALNIKETTAKVLHYRALRKLKVNLEKYNHV